LLFMKDRERKRFGRHLQGTTGMCWSPTADLIAGSAVTVLGVVAVSSTRRARDLPLALLPVVLGVHQLIESLVWRSADGEIGAGIGHIATILWVVIAYPLLPALVPLAALATAGRGTRMRQLPFTALGLITCAVLAYDIASGPVSAEAVGHTMRYGVHVPYANAFVAAYLVATIGALLMSDQQEIRTLGLVIAAGALVCFVLWQAAFVSTWCALAAVTSVIVLHWSRRPVGAAGRSAARRGPTPARSRPR
jgi:hypothetical protein